MSDLARLKEQLTDAFGFSEGEVDRVTGDAPDAKAPPVPEALTSQSNTGLLAACAFLCAAGTTAWFVTWWLDSGAIVVTFYALMALSGLTGFVVLAWRGSVSRNGGALDAQRQEEKQIRNAALIAEVHEAMGDLVITRDMKRLILHANGAFREMTGCATPEGKSCEDIGIAFRPGGKPHCYDVEIATPYGQRIFSWHDIVTQDMASSRLVISSIARDVSEERAALVTREEARLRAENADAAKGRLLATVSHEIRLPLSGILGMNHLLSQTKLTSEQRNYLDGMRQSGQALVQLVEDLLDFSTMEAGRFRLNPNAENLRQLIESVVEMLAHRAHEKGIEIASLVAPDVPDRLDFDPARLRQVLFNLIGNAVKFTAKGGVLVRAAMSNGELSLAVEDTGPGMGRAEQARIFGEFEQAGSARQRSTGTGLGLAISARIVREFGGSLTVSSQKGRGSTFLLTFRPAVVGDKVARLQRMEALKQSTVLLLCPAGIASNATARSIRALGGYCIEVATMRQLEECHAAGELAAITDIIIDHRVASTFRKWLQQLRSLDQRKSVRCILLVNPEERALQKQEDFDAWLIRPLRENSMVEVLCGRLKGLERRDALNDNHPGFGFSPAIAPVREKTGAFHDLTVLVAEDDPVMARIIRAVLEKSGCKVNVVDDFLALSSGIYTEGPLPDLVLSDLNMPGGEGMDVLPRIARRLQERQVPLIVLSADTQPATRAALSDAGIDLVLPKPIEPKRLIEEILQLFPRTGSGEF